MYGMSCDKYHNYIMKNFGTDRIIVDNCKKEILKQKRYVFLGEFIRKLIPVQPLKIECNTQDETYSFLSSILERITEIMSIQQAFYELACESKLMPVNLSSSSNYLNPIIRLEYITRSSNMTSTEPDTIDIPLLPNLKYIRVN